MCSVVTTTDFAFGFFVRAATVLLLAHDSLTAAAAAATAAAGVAAAPMVKPLLLPSVLKRVLL